MTPAARTATVLVLVVGATLGVIAQKLQSRTIFIEAVNATGAPVADLKPADLELAEGNSRRQIVKTELGTAPMRIAFLVDTSAQAEQMIGIARSGLNAFLTAYTGSDEIALVAIGRQPRVLLKPTTDRAKIKKAFDGLFPDGGATVVLDGVRDTYSQIMKQAEVHWPVFVIVTTATVDGSAAMQPNDYGKFVDELRMKGATVHAIAVQIKEIGSAIEYAQNLAKSTGGSFETITAPGGLSDKIKALAPRIAADHQKMATRYSLEFLGDPKAGGEVEITILRPGVKVPRMSNVRPF
jgi:Mg-chelatase subunit ChlD